jgi:hypothetical protein
MTLVINCSGDFLIDVFSLRPSSHHNTFGCIIGTLMAVHSINGIPAFTSEPHPTASVTKNEADSIRIELRKRPNELITNSHLGLYRHCTSWGGENFKNLYLA